MPKLYDQTTIIYNSQIQECVKTLQNNTLYILFTTNLVKHYFHGRGQMLISPTCVHLRSIAMVYHCKIRKGRRFQT